MSNNMNETELLMTIATELSKDLSQSVTNREVTRTEEVVESESTGSGELTPVSKCCLKKKCYEKVLPKTQNELFNNFWRIGDYAKQNYYLVGLMAAQTPKQITIRPMKKNKTLSWKYWADIRGRKIQVCKGFFLAVYGVSDKRLRVLQTKLVEGEPLEDQRGRYMKEKRANQYTVKRKIKSEAEEGLLLQPNQSQLITEEPKSEKRRATTSDTNSTLINSINSINSNGILLNEIIIPQNFNQILNNNNI